MPNDQLNGGNGHDFDLLPQHKALLIEAGISLSAIAQRGYRSLTVKEELMAQGFHPNQGGIPALDIPIHGFSEQSVLHLIRPDRPRVREGTKLEFEQPKGSRLRLDVPLGSQAGLANPSIRLWIVDGPIQADALISRGETCVAVLGYQGWRHILKSGKEPLREWHQLQLNDREVIIAFRSNSIETPEGEDEVLRFGRFLEGRGANVRFVIPRPRQDGHILSIDKQLNADATILNSIESEGYWAPTQPDEFIVNFHPYLAIQDAIFKSIQTKDGERLVQLSNFDVRIVADIIQDDGIEQRRFFELQATIRERVYSSEYHRKNLSN